MKAIELYIVRYIYRHNTFSGPAISNATILMFFLIFGAALVLKTVRGIFKVAGTILIILCVYRFLSLYLM